MPAPRSEKPEGRRMNIFGLLAFVVTTRARTSNLIRIIFASVFAVGLMSGLLLVAANGLPFGDIGIPEPVMELLRDMPLARPIALILGILGLTSTGVVSTAVTKKAFREFHAWRKRRGVEGTTDQQSKSRR